MVDDVRITAPGSPRWRATHRYSGNIADSCVRLHVLAGRYLAVRRGNVAFSLGGNLLLKLVGELRDEAGHSCLRQSGCRSRTISRRSRMRSLRRSMSRFYTASLLSASIAKGKRRRAHRSHAQSGTDQVSARSFRQFDDVATALMHGFDVLPIIMRARGSRAFLRRIRVPTWLLTGACRGPTVWAVLVTFYPFLVVTRQIGGGACVWLPYWHVVAGGSTSQRKYGQWAPFMDEDLFTDLMRQARHSGRLAAAFSVP
jgi:hypothetical protein